MKKRLMITKLPAKFLEENEDIEARLTQAAKVVLNLAQEESRRLQHKVIGTEQILLGLLAEGTGPAAQVLMAKGIDLNKTRSEVERMLSVFSAVEASEIPFSPTAKQSLKLSLEAAQELGHCDIDTGHLLLGLIHQGRQGEGVAVWILRNFNVNLQKLEQQILEHLNNSRLIETDQSDWTTSNAALSNSQLPDSIASEISARLIFWLVSWVYPRKLGHIFSQRGFELPNKGNFVLGISFMPSKVFKLNPPSYIGIVPDLAVEIKSGNQQLLSLQAKIQHLLSLGLLVGVLIDPDDRNVIIYRANGEVTILTDGDMLSIPELLPGWQLAVSDLWLSEVD